MIELKGISKSFGEKHVLKNISTHFEAGKCNLIIGASGSGKSTLTKCIVGLLATDEGNVLYDNVDFASLKEKERKKIRKEIGFLFQYSALFDSMTVAENIKFPMRMFTKKTENEMDDRVEFCLQKVNLEGCADLFPSELSGGMKKRVGIARAISMETKYLFCDEPNSGLDPQTAVLIDNLIQEITREFNITTIVVTHDMNSVIEIGDNIMFIHKGEKWWEGSNKDILTTDNKEVVDFVYTSKFMQKLRP